MTLPTRPRAERSQALEGDPAAADGRGGGDRGGEAPEQARGAERAADARGGQADHSRVLSQPREFRARNVENHARKFHHTHGFDHTANEGFFSRTARASPWTLDARGCWDPRGTGRRARYAMNVVAASAPFVGAAARHRTAGRVAREIAPRRPSLGRVARREAAVRGGSSRRRSPLAALSPRRLGDHRERRRARAVRPRGRRRRRPVRVGTVDPRPGDAAILRATRAERRTEAQGGRAPQRRRGQQRRAHPPQSRGPRLRRVLPPDLVRRGLSKHLGRVPVGGRPQRRARGVRTSRRPARGCAADEPVLGPGR